MPHPALGIPSGAPDIAGTLAAPTTPGYVAPAAPAVKPDYSSVGVPQAEGIGAYVEGGPQGTRALRRDDNAHMNVSEPLNPQQVTALQGEWAKEPENVAEKARVAGLPPGTPSYIPVTSQSPGGARTTQIVEPDATGKMPGVQAGGKTVLPGLSPQEFITQTQGAGGGQVGAKPILMDGKPTGKMEVTTMDPTTHKLVTHIESVSDEEKNINDFKTFFDGFAGEHPKLKGDALKAAASKEWHKQKVAEQSTVKIAGAEAFGRNRLYPVLDSKNGNTPTMITPEENMMNPGRYMPAAGGAAALTKGGTFNELRNAAGNLRKSVENLKGDFSAGQRAQFASALKSRDPHSALSNLIGSEWGKSLTPDQVDYVTDVNQMVESAMAMRTVLGTGQGSDLAREAMERTVPGLATPSKAFAKVQLDKLDSQLNALEKYIPEVKPRELKPVGVGKGAGNNAKATFIKNAVSHGYSKKEAEDHWNKKAGGQ